MKVEVLKEGVHSGGASGHVPSSFRIARKLLSLVEDENTGEILVDELHTKIPEHRLKETETLVSILGDEVVQEFPWKNDMKPSTNDKVEGVLRRTWRPALSIVGSSDFVWKFLQAFRSSDSQKILLKGISWMMCHDSIA